VIFCGLSEAVSIIVIDPVRGPATVGAKVIVMGQLTPAETEVLQSFVWAKSPLETMEVIFKARAPTLVSVIVRCVSSKSAFPFPQIALI
jgi:hypothetical protein